MFYKELNKKLKNYPLSIIHTNTIKKNDTKNSKKIKFNFHIYQSYFLFIFVHSIIKLLSYLLYLLWLLSYF